MDGGGLFATISGMSPEPGALHLQCGKGTGELVWQRAVIRPTEQAGNWIELDIQCIRSKDGKKQQRERQITEEVSLLELTTIRR